MIEANRQAKLLTTYRQYGVFVDNEDAEKAETDRFAVQSVQEDVQLQTNRRQNLRTIAMRNKTARVLCF